MKPLSNYHPHSVREAVESLLACMEEEDRDYILSKDIDDLVAESHMGLALEIRNEWIYSGDLGGPDAPGRIQPLFLDPDSLSSKVVEDFFATVQAQAGKEEFFCRYPDCPASEPIERLDLVMKREFAEAILRGEKTVEYRDYSQHYCSRLYDSKVTGYESHIADEDMDDFVDFARPLRKVESIHFHDYNNSWFLDVKVEDNWTVSVVREEVEMLSEEYGSDELMPLLEELEARGAQERPLFFYFALGEVIGTSLQD